jgi:hypothetical protein
LRLDRDRVTASALNNQSTRRDVDTSQREVGDRRERLRRHLRAIDAQRRLRQNKESSILLSRDVVKNKRIVKNPLVAVVQNLPKNQSTDVLEHAFKKPVTIT